MQIRPPSLCVNSHSKGSFQGANLDELRDDLAGTTLRGYPIERNARLLASALFEVMH